MDYELRSVFLTFLCISAYNGRLHHHTARFCTTFWRWCALVADSLHLFLWY